MAGQVQQEMEKLLMEAFSPTRLEVINDSASHAGHSGDDGSGESHFTVVIEAPAFADMNRVERQRAVNKALGDLMRDKVHALRINARAPGEIAE